MLDTEGLKAAEHYDRCLHLGQDAASLHFELLNLADLVSILGIRGACLDYKDSSRADLC